MKKPDIRLASLALLLVMGSGAASAQEQGLTGSVTDENGDVIRIAIPAMPPQQMVETPAGSTELLGEKIAEVIANDLKGSGLFAPMGPGGLARPSMAEVTAPAYPRWAGIGAESLVQGFVRSTGGDAQITVGCYLYDVALKQELIRQGYVVAPRATGVAPPIAAPTRSIRASPARARSSTAALPISPRPVPRISASSASRSWIRTAPTIASSPMARALP